MKVVRLGIWGIIVVLFTFLAAIPVVWATDQSAPNLTIPTQTPVVDRPIVGTPTATPIPLLPESGDGAQGNGFFILTGIFLAGSVLALLLTGLWKARQGDRLIR